jgi:hypothetical protein
MEFYLRVIWKNTKEKLIGMLKLFEQKNIVSTLQAAPYILLIIFMKPA